MSNFIIKYNDTYYYGVNETKNARVFFMALNNNSIDYQFYGEIPQNTNSQDVSDTDAMLQIEIFATEYPLHSDLPDIEIPEEIDKSGDSNPETAPVETVSDALSKIQTQIDDTKTDIDNQLTELQENIIRPIQTQLDSNTTKLTELQDNVNTNVQKIQEEITEIKNTLQDMMTALNKLQTFWKNI